MYKVKPCQDFSSLLCILNLGSYSFILKRSVDQLLRMRTRGQPYPGISASSWVLQPWMRTPRAHELDLHCLGGKFQYSSSIHFVQWTSIVSYIMHTDRWTRVMPTKRGMLQCFCGQGCIYEDIVHFYRFQAVTHNDRREMKI
jgi:hypothetical protein